MKVIGVLLLAVGILAVIGVAAFAASAANLSMAAYTDENQGSYGMHQWMMQDRYSYQYDHDCMEISEQNQAQYQYDLNYCYDQNCSGECQENSYQYENEFCYMVNNSYECHD